jgi:hypothetical protein
MHNTEYTPEANPERAILSGPPLVTSDIDIQPAEPDFDVDDLAWELCREEILADLEEGFDPDDPDLSAAVEEEDPERYVVSKAWALYRGYVTSRVDGLNCPCCVSRTILNFVERFRDKVAEYQMVASRQAA